MKVLVYGAGVIGCELVHILIKSGNKVTLLARGKWKENIDDNGLIIKHYIQMKTTVDKVKTIGKLEENDEYDIIFVVMQYGQMKNILSVLGRNKSRYIVLVGNNISAETFRNKILENSTSEKEIAFAFQATGGRREGKKVISVHLGCRLTIGDSQNELSSQFKSVLKSTFNNERYKEEINMDAWLKCHLAFILPICYVCYKYNGNLKLATKQDINNIIDATIEAYEMLKIIGCPIRPDGTEEYFINKRKKCYLMLKVMSKTSLGKLAASDHAMHAVDEIILLDSEFIKLRKNYLKPMNIYDKLRSEGMNSKFKM